MAMLLSSCNKTNNKDMLAGSLDTTTIVELSNQELEEKISNEENFVLVILLSFCSTCLNFKNNVVDPFILKTNTIVYGINASELENTNSYPNKPTYKTAPCILIYQNGKNTNKINYSDNKKEFKDSLAFKKYVSSYFELAKIIDIKEETLDNKIVNKESFLLYIGWNKCGDCKQIEENVLNEFLIKNNCKIYYLESDFYRKNKPFEEPKIEDYENDNEKYLNDMQNWSLWIEFATKYNFISYRNGKIPTIQYYQDGLLKDMIVYLNDEIKEGVIINSYYQELINKNISNDDLILFHNQKVSEFLKKYNI